MNSQGRHTPMPPQLTIFLCWMAYTAAYPGRYSYNSNITPIMDAFGVTHGEAGLVTTCFFSHMASGRWSTACGAAAIPAGGLSPFPWPAPLC